VDLAGSEKVSNHNNLNDIMVKENENYISKLKEDRVKEGKSINKSLFFLTQVIGMKSEGKNEHIPYRNSPLTKILKSSLGGNSRTVIILCATPVHTQYEQTLSTIRFGMSAKKIENTIKANVTEHNGAEAYELMINEYEERLKEMEKLRGADQQKVEYMINMINELQKQKDLLNEKLKKANGDRFLLKISKPNPEQNINKNEENSINKDTFMKNLGILFTNAKNELFSTKANEINENNIIFDQKAKFAIFALKTMKNKQKLYEEKYGILYDFYQKLQKNVSLEFSNIKIIQENYKKLSQKYVFFQDFILKKGYFTQRKY